MQNKKNLSYGFTVYRTSCLKIRTNWKRWKLLYYNTNLIVELRWAGTLAFRRREKAHLVFRGVHREGEKSEPDWLPRQPWSYLLSVTIGLIWHCWHTLNTLPGQDVRRFFTNYNVKVSYRMFMKNLESCSRSWLHARRHKTQAVLLVLVVCGEETRGPEIRLLVCVLCG